MSETIVAVDAMGGDNAPGEIVKGAVDAINKVKDLKVILVGDEQAIHTELKKYTFDFPRITIKATTEVIETAEPPVVAIKKKKDSSLVVAMQMIKTGEADAMVSAGNSGAILVGGQLYAGRVKGIKRAPLAPLIPTAKGVSLLVDCGANVDARAEHLVQFARMGSIYMEHVMGKKNPRVAIVNIGAEEEKGNALVKETFPMLKAATDINFIGSIEAREIPSGYADVIVCEAFVGNVILKMYEGVSKTFLKVMKEAFLSSLKSKIGAALALPALKKKLRAFDATQYGGAPLLGLNGLIVKTHGSAKAKEVTNSIIQCISFKEQKINEKIRESFSQDDK
ncbi:MAG: phosphate acyltransferase PlsX [Lachnospiraceae bacterium]|nr:phosphate acyltransferase PlsX [Lachnospiraceae bacterium]